MKPIVIRISIVLSRVTIPHVIMGGRLFKTNAREPRIKFLAHCAKSVILVLVLFLNSNVHAQIAFETRHDTAFLNIKGVCLDDTQINLGTFTAWSVDTTNTGWIPVEHILLVSTDTIEDRPQWYAYGMFFFGKTYYEYHSEELLFTQWPAILQSMPRPKALQKIREVMKF